MSGCHDSDPRPAGTMLPNGDEHPGDVSDDNSTLEELIDRPLEALAKLESRVDGALAPYESSLTKLLKMLMIALLLTTAALIVWAFFIPKHRHYTAIISKASVDSPLEQNTACSVRLACKPGIFGMFHRGPALGRDSMTLECPSAAVQDVLPALCSLHTRSVGRSANYRITIDHVHASAELRSATGWRAQVELRAPMHAR